MMRTNIAFNLLTLFCFSLALAQEKPSDTTKVELLDEVVLTGQLNPQSIDKSIFEVKVIGRKEIEQRAGVNLADLLNQTLNINIIPNLSNGRSEVSLFGLDGQYFKVLIDNVPLINEAGFGNGADLSLINLDDVERIEIVEGAMGVQYGFNAFSGIINIITKKSSRYKTEASLYIQEETVGSEYAVSDQGRHIQSVSASHEFSDKFFTRVGILRNDFKGYFNDKQGENYEFNDSLRGHEWFPKTQINTNALIKYTANNNFSIDYRFDYLTETIFRYSRIVRENFNSSTGLTNPTARDNELTANRFVHTLNTNGTFGKDLNYNAIVSFQQQRNDAEFYTYDIKRDQKSDIDKREYLSRDVIFSRASLSNIFKTYKFNLQLGYEMTLEEGFADSTTILNVEEGDVAKGQLDSYDFFASSEYNFSKAFSLRPGVRVSFSNLFSPIYLVSLSSKLLLGNGFEFRTVIGTADKTPTYDELYTFFVDSNHDVQGNPNLNPESGYTVFAHLKKKFKLKNNLNITSKLSVNYVDLEDRISLIISNPQPLAFRYTNIDSYKMHGVFFENEIYFNRMRIGVGLSTQGISQVLNAETDSNDDFLYNFSGNLNASYSLPKWNTSLSLYLKHNGRVQQFVQKTNEEGELVFERGNQEAFSWLDFNIEKAFLEKQLVATIGARNILDINTVSTSNLPGGAHSDAPSNIGLSYGRSFFLKLNYNLKI